MILKHKNVPNGDALMHTANPVQVAVPNVRFVTMELSQWKMESVDLLFALNQSVNIIVVQWIGKAVIGAFLGGKETKTADAYSGLVLRTVNIAIGIDKSAGNVRLALLLLMISNVKRKNATI